MKGDAFFEVELKRVRDGAKIPNFRLGHGCQAWIFTLASTDPCRSRRGVPSVLVPTGISISIRRSHVVALIFPRSGLGHKQGLVMGNGTGVIDPDYQGELMCALLEPETSRWTPSASSLATPATASARLVLMPIFRPQFVEVTEFGDGNRARAWQRPGARPRVAA